MKVGDIVRARNDRRYTGVVIAVGNNGYGEYVKVQYFPVKCHDGSLYDKIDTHYAGSLEKVS